VNVPFPKLQRCEVRIRGSKIRAYERGSWQETGVRQDAYASEHRIRVEEEKVKAEPQLAGP
jgi:hypothetical protein